MTDVALGLRLPTGVGRWLRLSVVGEGPLGRRYIAEHLPAEWQDDGPDHGSLSLEVSDHADPTAAVSTVGDERVEHFKGSWLLRNRGLSGTTLVDPEGHYALEAIGEPVRHVRAWRRDPGPTAESLVLRVARDRLHHELHRRGYVLLHAAVVSRQGRRVAFVGDKGAGKSAWMLRALARGWDLVANDRVFVDPVTRDVIALPIAAMLDRASLPRLPARLREDIESDRILRSDHHVAGYAKVGLAPAELVRAFGVRLAPRGELDHVVVLGEPPDLDDLLARNLYTPRDPTYAFDLLGPASTPTGSPQRLLPVLRERLVTLPFDWRGFDAPTGRGPAIDLPSLLAPFEPRRPAEARA